jgi:SAM-dependent methyltransferase
MDKNPGKVRLNPPLWRHDWYSLIQLKQGIAKIIKDNQLGLNNEKIVDIGCGDYPYRSMFTRHGCEYVGCDIDNKADILIQQGKPIALPDSSFDAVVSFQVLEHVWDLDEYLGECYRLVKPGGWLLLSTHGNWLYHPHPNDYRRWTREGLLREIESRGFVFKDCLSIVGPLAWTTQFRLLGYYTVLQRLGTLGTIFLFPIACFMNLRMVIEDAITPDSIRDTNASVYITLFQK